MEKIKVSFEGGESRYNPFNTQGVDYMLARTVDEDSEDIELYAEVDLIDTPYAVPFSENDTLEDIKDIIYEIYDENPLYRPFFKKLIELDEDELVELIEDWKEFNYRVFDFFEKQNFADLSSAYTYPLLKEEIIKQAVENGIDPERLEFPCE